ncbi:MAG: lysophospholipid acyltransferase family protein [Myxococcota bacterium]|nr:lysophospholipid acyltransferase family protein [Myxococcota bacterium]
MIPPSPKQPPPRPLSLPSGWWGTQAARALVWGVRAAPLWWLEALCRGAAALAWTLRIRRRVLLDNLALAFPELPEAQRRRIGKGVYRNMTRAVLDGLRGPALSREALAQTVVVDSWGSLREAYASGKGVLLATAHFGSWELLGGVLTSCDFNVSAVVRPLKGSFNAELMRSRQESGLKLIAARGAVQGMIKAVRAGDLVVMLLDQTVPAEKGAFVPFFGRLASTSPGLALTAIRTRAPLYVLMAAREGAKLRFFVEGPVPVPSEGKLDDRIREMTLQVTQILERYIRRYPDQWLWLHRRWKETPPPSAQA